MFAAMLLIYGHTLYKGKGGNGSGETLCYDIFTKIGL